MWLGDVPSPAPCAVLGPLPGTVPCWVLEQRPSLGTILGGLSPTKPPVTAALRCPRCPRLGAGCF